MLTAEDVKNIITLIGRAQITGAEAIVVVKLIEKLNQLNRTESDDKDG